MIHIVFQEADVEIIKKAIELDNSTHKKEINASLSGEILEIKDEFAVGPISNIYEEEGYKNRRGWWKEALEFTPYLENMDIVNDKLTVHNLIRKLDEQPDEIVWLWLGQNTHDVCGYYWLISQLKDYAGRIYILYLNNLPFINEQGSLYYPTAIHKIMPSEILKAKKLARKVTTSEFEVDTDEWQKLCDTNAIVRILEGGKKIINKEESYYDHYIFSAVSNEQQKLSKVFSTLFGKLKVNTGDVFLFWRMRKLAEEGKLVITGDWQKGWKDISISKPAEQNIEL